MIKYLFNTDGYYVAYIYNGIYCFSPNNEYIGFMKGIKLYDYHGKYIGTLTSDDRIIKNKLIKEPNIIPIVKPSKPLRPLTPLCRLKMPRLGNEYIDVFINSNSENNFFKYDEIFNKYLDSKLYDYHGKFLGNVNLNKYDKDSISNRFGVYGSQYSSMSVFNKYGQYGSKYSIYSPFNQISSYYLTLKKNNTIIGYLSDNNRIGTNVINATDFFNWFKEKIK